MFNPAAYHNSRPDGIGVLEVSNGAGPSEQKPRQFVPLKRTELRGGVSGPLASLSLTQVYGYSREQCDKVLEAVYRFPLPGDAAVTGVKVSFGDVKIRTELKPRRQAEADYDEARQQGKQAALLTRESPDIFTLQVAGIQSDQDVAVETSYVQLARPEGAGWSLRVPLTTAPRYTRSDEATARHAKGQPLLLLRDPGHRFLLDLSLPGAGSAASSTHKLEVARDGESLRVQLRDGEVIPDRDLVLSWTPRQDRDRPGLQVLLHDDAASEQVYFLALLAPPVSPTPEQRLPREVIVLVDHSGSMEGPKWEAADWAVKKFLSELAEGDSFGLALFHDRTRWFSDAPVKADRRSVERAIDFLKKHHDSGGTELGVALEQALHLDRTHGDLARHVLVITDAQVSDEGRILRLAGEESGRGDRRRISVLCIDAAPNSFLALELAKRGGGIARFLTSSPDEEDISTALDELLADWGQPVLAGLALGVDRPEAQASGRETLPAVQPEHSLIDLGDLPAGRTVWVAGRARRWTGRKISFQVIPSAGAEVAGCRLDLSGEANQRPALKALFGASQIIGLEFLIHSGYTGEEFLDRLKRLGYDPEKDLIRVPGKKPKVYAENVRKDVEEALRGLLVREALEYGLASSETAFIGVRAEQGKPVEGTVPVANALPSGWSESFLAPPSASPLYSTTGLAAPFPQVMARDAGVAPFAADPTFMKVASARPTPGARRKAHPPEAPKPLFSGIPVFEDGEAMLFDTARREDASRLPGGVTLSRLSIRFPGGLPKDQPVDPGLTLLIFVDDLAAPRAKVRLEDLVRQGGERPLNIAVSPGRRVVIVLCDPAGAWASAAPQIEVSLGY